MLGREDLGTHALVGTSARGEDGGFLPVRACVSGFRLIGAKRGSNLRRPRAMMRLSAWTSSVDDH